MSKKETDLLHNGFSTGKDDMAITRFKKTMEKDYEHFSRFKMICDDFNIEIPQYKELNYDVQGHSASGSWSDDDKRTIVAAFTDAVVEQSGLKPSKLLSIEKIFDITLTKDSMKILVEHLWKCNHPRFHSNSDLKDYYIDVYVRGYLYNPEAIETVKRLRSTINSMIDFGSKQPQIINEFKGYGISYDLHSVVGSKIEAFLRLSEDDDTLAKNVQGKPFKGFKKHISKKAHKREPVDYSPEGYVQRGLGSFLAPASRKAAEKKLKSSAFSKIGL